MGNNNKFLPKNAFYQVWVIFLALIRGGGQKDPPPGILTYKKSPYRIGLRPALQRTVSDLICKFDSGYGPCCTANVNAVKVTGFPCVTLEPCKVHVTIMGISIQPISL